VKLEASNVDEVPEVSGGQRSFVKKTWDEVGDVDDDRIKQWDESMIPEARIFNVWRHEVGDDVAEHEAGEDTCCSTSDDYLSWTPIL